MDAYKEGDFDKIRRFGERFWCQIKEIKYGTIIARANERFNNTLY